MLQHCIHCWKSEWCQILFEKCQVVNSNFETEPGQHWVTTPQHFGTSHKYNFGIFSNKRLSSFPKNIGILSNNRLSQIPNLVSSWALLIQANRGGQPTRVKALNPFFLSCLGCQFVTLHLKSDFLCSNQILFVPIVKYIFTNCLKYICTNCKLFSWIAKLIFPKKILHPGE